MPRRPYSISLPSLSVSTARRPMRVHRDRVAGHGVEPGGLDAIVVRPTSSPFRLTTAPPLMPRLSLASSWSRVGIVAELESCATLWHLVLLGLDAPGDVREDAPARRGLPSWAALNGLPSAIRNDPLRSCAASPERHRLEPGARASPGPRRARSRPGRCAGRPR